MTPEFEKVARKAVNEWKARGDDAPSAAHDLEVLCGKNSEEYRPDGERIIEDIYGGKLRSAAGGAGLTFEGKNPEQGPGSKTLDPQNPTRQNPTPGRVAVPNAESNPPGTPTEASKQPAGVQPELSKRDRDALDARNVRGTDPNAIRTAEPATHKSETEDSRLNTQQRSDEQKTPPKKR